jgi:hypothetical protein
MQHNMQQQHTGNPPPQHNMQQQHTMQQQPQVRPLANAFTACVVSSPSCPSLPPTWLMPTPPPPLPPNSGNSSEEV